MTLVLELLLPTLTALLLGAGLLTLGVSTLALEWRMLTERPAPERTAWLLGGSYTLMGAFFALLALSGLRALAAL